MAHLFSLGELITIDSVNRGFFDGVDIVKQFETDGSFTKHNFLEALKGDTGIVHNIAHGNGDILGLMDGYLSTEDVLSLPQSDKTPIVLSIACSNGAYDTHLVNHGFKISFGESILLSDAGGIAYIGGSRSNLGFPIFTLDKGYVDIIKEPHMAGMLTYVLEAYHAGGETLGNITTNAMITYVENNNMFHPMDIFTFFSFVLLGDPALKIPTRPIRDIYQLPRSVPEDPLGYMRRDVNGSIPITPLKEPMNITTTTNSSTVEMKLIDTYKKSDYIVEKIDTSTVDNNVSYVFNPDSSSLYLFKTCAEDGKEGWLYALPALVVNNDYDSSTPGWGVTRWTTIKDAINNSNESLHGSKAEVIYVFNGTYYENIVLDKQIDLIGENKETTILDGRGCGDIVSIDSPNCSISGFTITRSGNKKNNAGVTIKPDWIDVDIYDNIIENNTNGVFIHEKTHGIIRIEYNKICNNTYGIHQNNKRLLIASNVMFIENNIIKDNKYGIYIQKSGFFLIKNVVQPTTNKIIFNTISKNNLGIFDIGQ